MEPTQTPTAEPTAIATENAVDNSNEDFSDTMYDYSYAGVDSAKKRVKKEDYISAADYGIIANTGKDYSQEITNAIYDASSKGKYLYFPAGTYYVKNVKIWNRDGVKICGEGTKSIIKTADDAVGDVKWDIAMGLYNCNNCIVRNITFDGNNENVYGTTEAGVVQLRIDNCDNASVFGCRFQNNNSCNLNIVGKADKLKVFYNDFLNSDVSVGVSPGYITNGYICNNFVDAQEWVWSEPISLYYSPNDEEANDNVIISGNDIRNHTETAGGVFITYPSKNIYVMNNYFYRCGAGIGCGSKRQYKELTDGPWDIVCKDNVIDSPTWYGFCLLYAKNWTIENNTITNITDGFAMYLDQCYDNVIRNNNIDGSKVYEVNSSGNKVSGNE